MASTALYDASLARRWSLGHPPVAFIALAGTWDTLGDVVAITPIRRVNLQDGDLVDQEGGRVAWSLAISRIRPATLDGQSSSPPPPKSVQDAP